ncbi:MAG: rRNA maturation RNase YbeY [Lachnospiraceae bacterium]|nr:rRNA maturation RNase YbeY [Lachnospiraceae bacterium]
MSIFFENELDKPLPDGYKDIVREIVQAAIEYVDCPYECEVNVIFTNNQGIEAINNEFRGLKSPTDVLSFPMIDYEKPEDFQGLEDTPWEYFNQDTGELMLGDIVLNVDRIVSQAKEYGHTRSREIAFLTAHSMLHLFGHDHVDDHERLIMEDKQEQILSMKGYTRDNEQEKI